MSSGNKAAAFTAPRDGVVYVRDDSDNRIVYSGDVKKGQIVRYDSRARQVKVDDDVVAHPSGNDHPHSIFFHPSGGAEDSDTSGIVRDANAAGRPTTAPASNVPVIRVPLGVQVDVQTQPAGGN
jgi:hypothetical protein